MKINLNNKKFKAQANSANGEVSGQTLFQYYQEGEIIWADYAGGEIIRGSIIGKYTNEDFFEFTYQHINSNFELMTGKCKSYPRIDDRGKIIVDEHWQWTCLDRSEGKSILIEV